MTVTELIERLQKRYDSAEGSDMDCEAADALEAQAREIAELKAWHAAGYAGQLEKRLAEREETIRKFGTVQHGLLCRAEAAESQLAEAERDAARYRWLRDNKFSGPGVWVDSDDGIRHFIGEQADRTVDAAMEGGE